MRIAIVTDAWTPQVNGVVNAIGNLIRELENRGHDILLISPDRFRSVPCPTYPEIRLALAGPSAVGKLIEDFAPDAVHLMTEGPLGLACRTWCRRRGIPFTTAYCTNFPEYVALRTGLPASWFWPLFRWFHRAAAATVGSTPSLRRQLMEQGIAPVLPWGRGVDLTLFAPEVLPPDIYLSLPRPIALYVGRVAVEKNIEAFLSLDLPGSKVVVGDGPAREELALRYPDALFLGVQRGKRLAACYAGADVFVFPSLTDTFGVVMIEALACGTPVAAFPVNGPVDIVKPGIGGLDRDLSAAVAAALKCDRNACAEYGRSFSWHASADQFLDALVFSDALGSPTQRLLEQPAPAGITG